MPAAEAMTVRTRRGIQTLPRRVALAMLSSGRASKVTSEEVAADQARVREEYQRVLSARAERARVTGLPVPGVTYAPGDAEDASTGRVRAQDVPVQGQGVVPDAAPVLEPVDELADEGLVDDVPTVEPVAIPDPPRGNAARKQWVAYATEYLGLEVTDDMTRNQIRDAAAVQLDALARMPQPAREGGRLDTPEDEPVAEGAASEDPGTR